MEFGDLIASRSVTAVTRQGPVQLYTTLTAPDKAKGKHTKNMLFMYLGVEDISNPVDQEEVCNRLGDLGWRKMNQEEYDEHCKKRGY